MARRKSIDSAFSSVIEGAVKDAVSKQLKPLRSEISKLRRSVERVAGRKSGTRGRKRGGGRKPIFEVCQVADCNRKHQSRGFCQRHYNRLRNRGTLDHWAAKIKNGETIRESMIAAQRGVPLSDRPKIKKRKKKAKRKSKSKSKGKSKGKRKSKSSK